MHTGYADNTLRGVSRPLLRACRLRLRSTVQFRAADAGLGGKRNLPLTRVLIAYQTLLLTGFPLLGGYKLADHAKSKGGHLLILFFGHKASSFASVFGRFMTGAAQCRGNPSVG